MDTRSHVGITFRVNTRRIRLRRIYLLSCIAWALVVCLPPPAGAQTLLDSTDLTEQMGCAPSNNGTGHMICLDVVNNFQLQGFSWEAPPAGNRPPGNGIEPPDTVDPLPIALASGTQALSTPACGPANDGQGTVTCLTVVRNGPNPPVWTVLGISLYPPTGFSATQQVGTIPSNVLYYNPSCASVSTQADGVVLCALLISGQVYSIALQPRTGVSTPLSPPAPVKSLPALTGLVGSPSCVSAAPPTAICVVITDRGTKGGDTDGLVAFTLQYNRATPNSPASVTYINSIAFPPIAYLSSVNCGVVGNSANTTGVTVTCAFYSYLDGNLRGTTFNLQAGTVTPTYQILGFPPDGGGWLTGGNGNACTSVNNGSATPSNLVTCAFLSDTSNIFQVSFDPRIGESEGFIGPLVTNMSNHPSCLELAIDVGQMYCGEIDNNGLANGLSLPVAF